MKGIFLILSLNIAVSPHLPLNKKYIIHRNQYESSMLQRLGINNIFYVAYIGIHWDCAEESIIMLP